MAVLTNEQALSYARNAGFSGQDLIRIVAIGRAESGLRTDAHNAEKGFDVRHNCGGACSSEGWLQILTCRNNSASDRSCHINRGTPEQLHDPQYCANKGYELYRGRGGKFTDWSVYNSGAYLVQMPLVSRSMGIATSPGDVGFDLPSTATVLGGMDNIQPQDEPCLITIPNPLGTDFCLLKTSWGIRLIEIIGGLILILLGVGMLAAELGLSALAAKTNKILKPAKGLVGAVKNA